MSDLAKIAYTVFICGVGGACLQIGAIFRDAHVRGWRSLDWLSIGLRVGAVVLSVAVATGGYLAATQRFGQLGNLQYSVDQLESNATPRHLSADESSILTSKLRSAPPGFKFMVERCVSDDSAVSLQNDFIAAIVAAGVSADGGGVTTTCPSGSFVAYASGDSRTEDFIHIALDQAGLTSKVGEITSPGLSPEPQSNTAILFIGLRNANSL